MAAADNTHEEHLDGLKHEGNERATPADAPKNPKVKVQENNDTEMTASAASGPSLVVWERWWFWKAKMLVN